MTGDQSRALKVGDRVCFIKWRDGHKSYTAHGDMKRIDLVKK
jgi:hypothetical protein